MPTAIITGASRGLGLALARALADRGYRLVIDARGAPELQRVATELEAITHVRALPGDVADDWHRGALIDAAGERVDLLVNNASTLGPSPQPELAAYPLETLRRVYDVNVIAPLALAQLALPLMPEGACIVNVTSDAAVEAYEGWGGYGSAKAALEQLTAILAAEEPSVRVYTVDPGDMRTQMHQEAFPGEDISDRPASGGQRPRPARADRIVAAQRPLPRSRDARLGAVVMSSALAFELPRSLEATEPPEARGAERDAVRLMVADADEDRITHAAFTELAEFLIPGDIVVVNVSATLPAAVAARRADGSAVRVHFATRAPKLDDRWRVVELRSPDGASPARGRAGETLALPGPDATHPELELVAPYASGSRLMLAHVDGVGGSESVQDLLIHHGDPIRYGYVPRRWPLEAYQNVYARRARQRRDAERGAAFHPPAHLRAGHARNRGGPDHPAHRRLFPGASRAPVPRGVRGAGDHGPPGQHDPCGGRTGDRRRHHCRAGAGDGGPPRRLS